MHLGFERKLFKAAFLERAHGSVRSAKRAAAAAERGSHGPL
jgi:hypothetical protein